LFSVKEIERDFKEFKKYIESFEYRVIERLLLLGEPLLDLFFKREVVQ